MDPVAERTRLILQGKHRDEILTHVYDCLPEEACGLIAGLRQVSQAVYQITNELHSPARFRMSPIEQLQAFLNIEEQGWELAAIYHSHPKGPPEPSETDMAEFAYPGVPYLIWHPNGASWACGCYILSKAGYDAVQLQITDDKM